MIPARDRQEEDGEGGEGIHPYHEMTREINCTTALSAFAIHPYFIFQYRSA